MLVGFLHLIGFIVVFGIGASLASGGEALVMNAGVASLVAPLVALYVALVRWAPHERLRTAVGLTRVPGGLGGTVAVVALAMLLGAALAPLAAELTARVFALFPMPPLDADQQRELDELDRVSGGTLLLVYGLLTLLVPLVEELLYRGFLQRRVVLPTGRVRTAMLVAVVYALVQLNPRFSPAALLLGAGLAYVQYVGGSTWVSVAAHVAHRLAPFALAVLVATPLPDYMTGSETGTGEFLPWELTAGCAAVALLAAAALWQRRSVAPEVEPPKAPGAPSPDV